MIPFNCINYIVYNECSIDCPHLAVGSSGSSVFRAPESWSKCLGFESRQERRENFLLQCQHFVLTHIPVSVPPPCYRRSAGGRLQLNTHTPYVCGFAWSDMVYGCMVYTEPAPSWQQFYVAPAMSALYVHHFGGYSKNAVKKTHASDSCRITCRESARERRIALYKAITIIITTLSLSLS